MSTVTINGRTYTGNNVNVVNGHVIIDGKDVTNEAVGDQKVINIAVNGAINQLTVDSCQKIGIIGDCGSIKTASGDIDIKGNVNGNVSTMSGDIKCGNVIGDVSSMSGDIN